MKGKEKCRALKEIRRQIAEKNDIAYVVSECTYQGECKGTCPKCEAELRYLEKELAVRKSLGKAVAVAGISAGVCVSLTACSPAQALEEFTYSALERLGIVETTQQLTGDTELMPTDTPQPADTPEPTEAPVEVEAILKGEVLVGEMPMDTPSPEVLEGKIVPKATLLPEVDGEIDILEIPTTDIAGEYILEGDIAVAPKEADSDGGE